MKPFASSSVTQTHAERFAGFAPSSKAYNDMPPYAINITNFPVAQLSPSWGYRSMPWLTVFKGRVLPVTLPAPL